MKRAEPFKSRSQTASSLPTSCVGFAQAPHGLCVAATGQLVWIFSLFTHRSLIGARVVLCLGSQTGSWYRGWDAEVSTTTSGQPGTSYRFLSGHNNDFISELCTDLSPNHVLLREALCSFCGSDGCWPACCRSTALPLFLPCMALPVINPDLSHNGNTVNSPG